MIYGLSAVRSDPQCCSYTFCRCCGNEIYDPDLWDSGICEDCREDDEEEEEQ